MENKLTAEQIEKAKTCKSVEEMITLAKENGISLTEAEAKNLFAKLNPKNSELSDSELEAVSGGCNDDDEDEIPELDKCPAGGRHDWVITTIASGLAYIKCKKCGEYHPWAEKSIEIRKTN